MRILLLLVTGYVLGEGISLTDSIAIRIAVPLIFVGAVWLFGKRYGGKQKRWLIGLPFFVLFGIWYSRYFAAEGQAEKILPDQQRGTLLGTAGSIMGKASGSAVYLEQCVFAYSGGTVRLPGKVVLFSVEEAARIRIGNEVRVTGILTKIEPPSNFGQFDSVVYYHSRGIYFQCREEEFEIVQPEVYWHYRNALRKIRDHMEQAYLRYLGERDAGVVSAMVLGQKTYLEEDRKKLYQQNGIAHILAISGLHVGFLGMMVYRRLRRWLLPAPVCAAVSLWLLVSYGIMSGMGGASQRAILMLAVTICGDVIGRTPDLLTSMGFAGFLMLLQNPIQIFDAGFLLSYGAIAGIGGIAPALGQILPGNGRLLQGLRSGLAVQLATTPILLSFYYELAPYSIILNLLVIPLMSILLPCAAAAGLMGPYAGWLGKAVCMPVSAILAVYDTGCGLCEMLPGHSLVVGKPSLAALAGYYILLSAGLYLLRNRKWNCLAPLACLVFSAVLIWQEKKPGVSILDVGQGDGIYLFTGQRHYLIDGGSSSVNGVGQYRIEPFLKAKGVGRLDGVFLTHMDEDHISGVRELLEDRYPVGAVMLADVKEKSLYEEIAALARENGTEVCYIADGDVIADSRSRITCLHPGAGTGETETNANSLVLDVAIDGKAMLFTGDLGQEQEEQILADPEKKERLENTAYTLLKVGHHGSKNSSGSAFLEAVRPQCAVISCGRENSYGHPHPEVLERLKVVGSRIFLTMEQGEIDVEIADGKTTARGFAGKNLISFVYISFPPWYDEL